MPPPPHYYGWQPSPPDQRDLLYAPNRLLGLPAFIDLTEPVEIANLPPFSPAYDQGALGSCGPNAVAGALAYDMLFESKWGNPPLPPMPSRLYVYWFARFLMGTTAYDSGVNNRSMLKALNQYGWCDEGLRPYTISEFAQRPSDECLAQAKSRRITSYLSVAQDLGVMKACLAVDRKPIVYGFTVYDSFETSEALRTGVVPMPKASDGVLGGHDVLLVGYDDTRAAFRFRNSWGEDYGERGYGWMPYAYATNPGLSGDFWTIRGSGFTPPAPPSVPALLVLNRDMVKGVYTLTPYKP